MSNHDGRWPHGTPCWVDFMAGDLDRTHRFYTALFGWAYEESMDEFGGYHNALLDGRRVAGLSPTVPGMEDAPKVWTVYLATDDIQATADAVVANGGQVVSAPMQVAGFGSMAVFTDPVGDLFGAWQAGTHQGFGAVDEHGTPLWMDLMSRDLEAAKDFYAKVFGYTYSDVSEEGMTYVMFEVPGGDRPAGGIGLLDDKGTAGWTVCFQVDDVDAAAAAVEPAGGTVSGGLEDTTYGRMASVAGPDAETVYLMTPNPM